MTRFFLISLAILLVSLSWKADQNNSKIFEKKSELNTLVSWMTGEFSSEGQAKNDSTYYSINLMMHPIWTEDTEVNWIYVEQALSTKLNEPYRQRIYKIGEVSDTEFYSEVYELSNPKAFIHAWKKPEIFDSLHPDSLSIREGCAVIMSRKSKKEFSGSTNDKACKSSLYGASYATSKVSVFKDKVISWDQGFDENDDQVWGAIKAGYVFLRK